MRTAELVFLGFLILYHAFLLVPRYRRPLASNYLVFLAGMALAWNLGMEGLRWQTLVPVVLILADVVVLLASFRTLRGRNPKEGFLAALGRVFRTLTASGAFLIAVVSAVLALAFPLPEVELSGGLSPSFRVLSFPPEDTRPGLEVHLWYPATGDPRPLPRPRIESGGPAPFWQSYLTELPSNLIKGGRLASPRTRYPVIFVALPEGQAAEDFGYLFEDLASRGFLVVAPEAPVSLMVKTRVPALDSLVADWKMPVEEPQRWLEPDRQLEAASAPTNLRLLESGVRALRQLDSQPGDLLYSAVDWGRVGLWSWGNLQGIPDNLIKDLGLSCVIQAGTKTTGPQAGSYKELWITGNTGGKKPSSNQWFLRVPALARADLSDSAYLKPYLSFFGLKSRTDAGSHGLVRQYQAAFLQFVFWHTGTGSTFGQTVPTVPGVELLGQ